MLYRRFRIISIFLVLAAVFALVGGALAFSKASVAQQVPLSVDFGTPTPPPGQFIPVCTRFTIVVHVRNNDPASADNVTATIVLLAGQRQPGAVLESGNSTQNNPSIPPGGSWDPQWTWHCVEVGQVNFQVTVAANGQDDIIITRSFWQGKPHLRVDINTPQDDTVFVPGTNFQVTATVTNTGQLVAEATTAMIAITGPASLVSDTVIKQIGDIAPQGSSQVRWSLRCDGQGDVVIIVTPDGLMSPPNRSALPIRIYADNLERDSVLVHQVDTSQQKGGESSPSPCVDRPGCAVCFSPSINVMPKELSAGQPVTIAVSASNNCEAAGIFVIPLSINGKVEQTQMVEINPHSSCPVQFTVIKNEPGTYTVNFDNYKASFVVVGNVGGNDTTGRNPVIPIIAIVVLAIISVALVMLIRRRPA